MSPVQKFFMWILPDRLAAEMRADSESWQVRCNTCSTSKTLWEVGGIRWKSSSGSKKTMVRCAHCGEMRGATVERVQPREL